MSNSAFLDALQSRSPGIKQDVDNRTTPIEVRVTLHLSIPREIRVTFSRFPGQAVIDSFHKSDFRWDAALKRWYAPDSQSARDYVNARFDAKLGPFEPQTAVVQPVQPNPVQPKPVPQMIVRPETPYELYQQQVAALCAHFKMEVGDLALKAVSELYIKTFEN